jgi:hypothetical protein
MLASPLDYYCTLSKTLRIHGPKLAAQAGRGETLPKATFPNNIFFSVSTLDADGSPASCLPFWVNLFSSLGLPKIRKYRIDLNHQTDSFLLHASHLSIGSTHRILHRKRPPTKPV